MFQGLKKASIIKLRIKSLFDDLENNYHFLAINLIFIALSIKYIYLLVLLIAYLIYLFINSKKIFIFSIIICIVFLVHYCIKNYFYKQAKNNGIIQITDIEKTNDKYKIIGRNGKCKYLFYTKEEIKIGDYYYIQGKEVKYDVRYPGQFDYDSYLHYQNIKRLDEITIKKVKEGFHISCIHYRIKSFLENKYHNSYLETLTIGDNGNLEMDNINKLGISHLFVISGLHMSIIILIIEKLLSLFKIKKRIVDIIVVIIGFTFLIIANFMISLIRVLITLVLKLFLKRLKALDILTINSLIVLNINPFLIFNLSFILSYLAAFFMIIYKPIIKTKKRFLNYLIDLYLISLLVQLFLLPITISMNPEINLLSFLVGPIFIMFVSFCFLPLSFLTIIIPPLIYLYNPISYYFETIVNYLGNINYLLIPLGNTVIILKIIYLVSFYLLLIGIYKKKMYLSIFLILTFICWYFKGIIISPTIYFYDLKKGEATLIMDTSQKEVILIDSGDYNNGDLTKSLIDLGVRHIDYLILSHTDSDHYAGSIEIVKRIRIDNLVTNEYEINNKTNYLKKYIKNHIILKGGKKIKTKSTLIECISPNGDYHNINDNSLVFNLTFKNLKILFTGDISKTVENELMKQNIKTNILKVAHHGSITSSSATFLASLQYDYSVIMSGYQNTFGFPNEEIVKRLKKPITTKKDGTIKLLFQNGQVIIRNFVEKNNKILYNKDGD